MAHTVVAHGPVRRERGRAAGARRACLREAVLRAGGRLGWNEREVVAFAEALVGRPWRRCGPLDLEGVLGEYVALARVAREKAERRANGAAGAGRP